MVANHKSEFAIPKCFSTGKLSFKRIFDLIVLYIVLFQINNRDFEIQDLDNSEKTYQVKLTKQYLNNICPRYSNEGSSYTMLRTALENATLLYKDDFGYGHIVPIFVCRKYHGATLYLEFNSVFSHIFDKTHKHLKSDPKDSEEIIRYTGFTLFDLNELMSIKTFYQARTFEFLHANSHNRQEDYAQGKRDTKLRIIDYYLALGKIYSYSGQLNEPDNRISEKDLTTLWKHVNETVFDRKPLKIGQSEVITAEKTGKEFITFTSINNRPEKATKTKDNSEKCPISEKTTSPNYKKPKKKNSFHNFPERVYDFKELEKEVGI